MPTDSCERCVPPGDRRASTFGNGTRSCGEALVDIGSGTIPLDHDSFDAAQLGRAGDHLRELLIQQRMLPPRDPDLALFQVSDRVTPSARARPSRRAARGHPFPADPAGRDNLTYLRIIEQVTDGGLTQQELGAAVGASPRSVQNWMSGATTPRGASRDRLLDLRYIVDELQKAYTDEGVQIWLHARNRSLSASRPIDLLAEGEFDRVLEEASRVSGAM